MLRSTRFAFATALICGSMLALSGTALARAPAARAPAIPLVGTNVAASDVSPPPACFPPGATGTPGIISVTVTRHGCNGQLIRAAMTCIFQFRGMQQTSEVYGPSTGVDGGTSKASCSITDSFVSVGYQMGIGGGRGWYPVQALNGP